jgi:hypothetical protein
LIKIREKGQILHVESRPKIMIMMMRTTMIIMMEHELRGTAWEDSAGGKIMGVNRLKVCHVSVHIHTHIHVRIT